MSGQPKAPFYVALFLVVAGLVAFAVYRSDLLAPKGKMHEAPGGTIDPNMLNQTAESKDSAAHYDRQRVFVQTRGTTAGSQRHFRVQGAGR